MNSKVYIKSYKNGLTVNLDTECLFTEILDEIIRKFRESRDFFKGGQIVDKMVGAQAKARIQEKFDALL